MEINIPFIEFVAVLFFLCITIFFMGENLITQPKILSIRFAFWFCLMMSILIIMEKT